MREIVYRCATKSLTIRLTSKRPPKRRISCCNAMKCVRCRCCDWSLMCYLHCAQDYLQRPRPGLKRATVRENNNWTGQPTTRVNWKIKTNCFDIWKTHQKFLFGHPVIKAFPQVTLFFTHDTHEMTMKFPNYR
jgi:hypothetical protein